ncbi:hypothetical protein EVAR_69558_1 [Eumeta japonica]|uniref:Uncharacterized protein n=1 Tax=Eumeta variegata TaxID=151549 RepID=A0A4C2A4N3_EUMVA|nr:hypothetical protein EVAR_69558_1 [Eumeta japonica]
MKWVAGFPLSVLTDMLWVILVEYRYCLRTFDRHKNEVAEDVTRGNNGCADEHLNLFRLRVRVTLARGVGPRSSSVFDTRYARARETRSAPHALAFDVSRRAKKGRRLRLCEG